MKELYILRPRAGNDDLWEPWFDKMFGIVVCATSEDEARQIASEDHGDEGSGAWLNSDYSTCKVLCVDDYNVGDDVIRDYASA